MSFALVCDVLFLCCLLLPVLLFVMLCASVFCVSFAIYLFLPLILSFIFFCCVVLCRCYVLCRFRCLRFFCVCVFVVGFTFGVRCFSFGVYYCLFSCILCFVCVLCCVVVLRVVGLKVCV